MHGSFWLCIVQFRDPMSPGTSCIAQELVGKAIDIELLPMGPAVFKRANFILEKCHPKVPLRSLDALHLASADQAQDWPLATHDSRMRASAQLLCFPLTSMP